MVRLQPPALQEQPQCEAAWSGHSSLLELEVESLVLVLELEFESLVLELLVLVLELESLVLVLELLVLI